MTFLKTPNADNEAAFLTARFDDHYILSCIQEPVFIWRIEFQAHCIDRFVEKQKKIKMSLLSTELFGVTLFRRLHTSMTVCIKNSTIRAMPRSRRCYVDFKASNSRI